jgi:HK97 gp10 family phage protein
MANLFSTKTTLPQFGTGIAGGQVQVLGAREAIAYFSGLGSRVALLTGHTTYELAQFIQKRAKELVPKETHNLETGINIEKAAVYTWSVVASSMEGTDPAGTGKDEKEYANYVEFGTSKMDARPYMRPAFAAAKPIAAAKLKALAKTITLL